VRLFMGKEKVKLTLERGCALFMTVYIVLSVALYFIAGDQFKYKNSDNSIVSEEATTPIGKLIIGTSVEQVFVLKTDTVDSISLKFATYARTNTGVVNIQLLDESDGNVLYKQEVDVSKLIDNEFLVIRPVKPLHLGVGRMMRISAFSDAGTSGNSVTLWYNNNIKKAGQELLINGEAVNGTLCFSITGRDIIQFGHYYFYIIIGFGLILLLYCAWLVYCKRTGKKSVGLGLLNAFNKYGFLLKQLVARDFKTKYKRSVLGVFWSFLNPLLMMIVQYIVFSTIFKNNIPNFAVYLLIGIVFFNFFSEATSMGLTSIVGNSSLITKVYIPKYIFPVSRVLSSAINLLISMIPLILAALITRAPITSALLLLPFSIVCIIIFCTGMCFILSSAMVFFRDMQFLWGVLSTLWMYATPIFYPESILPQQFMVLFKMNPLYHFIRFSRAIILDGISPEPQAYFLCIIASLVPLIVGIFAFMKTQDKFVLNI
jgi:ABC-2 type transport system permease protein